MSLLTCSLLLLLELPLALEPTEPACEPVLEAAPGVVEV
jgi:hypothetical protein